MKKKKIIIIIISIILILGILLGVIVYRKDSIFKNIELEKNENDNDNVSPNYMNEIGTSLVENDLIIPGESGTLFENLLIDGEKFQQGKQYEEKLCIKNSGSMDTFVRVIITKSWQDNNGNKDTNSNPELIELGLASEEDGWITNENGNSPERIILYHKNLVTPEEMTSNFLNYIRINPTIQTETNILEETTEDGYKVINMKKLFNGYAFNLEIEVDAIQTHNAHDVMLDRWGVDVTISEDEKSIISIN